jgi:hypothetical protein
MDRAGQHQSLLQQHQRTHSRSSSEGNRMLKLDPSDTDPLTKSEGGKATEQSILTAVMGFVHCVMCICCSRQLELHTGLELNPFQV